MLKLKTGAPGDGKTLLAISDARDEYERNKAANSLHVGDKKHEALREFWTDIDGINLDGSIPWFKDLRQHPDYRVEILEDGSKRVWFDWRVLADGSYVVYDESHQAFPTTGKPGRADDPVIRAMDEHRHRGFDLVFVTQYPTKIHHELRQMVKEHKHLFRAAMNLQSAAVWTFSRCISDPYDEKARIGAEDSLWTYPQELYGTYKSATVHTHKFKMPKKIKGMLFTSGMVAVVLLGLFLYFRPSSDADVTEAPESKNAPAFASGPLLGGDKLEGLLVMPRTGWEVAETETPLKGCAVLSMSCRCWNGEGKQLRISRFECVALAAEPLPIDFVPGALAGEEGSPGSRVASPVVAGMVSFADGGVRSDGGVMSGVPAPAGGGSRPWVGDNKRPVNSGMSP